MDSNYEFELISEFGHYVSSRDKTNVEINNYVKNSKNVYKKRSGTIANRPGLKVRGALNAERAGVVSSFEWDGPFAAPRVLRVTSDGKLSVEYDNNDGNGPIWYDLLTGLTKTRFIFSSEYFDNFQDKEILLMANGSVLQIFNWEGGITQVASATALVAGVINQGNGRGFRLSVAAGGTNYQIGDVLTIVQTGSSQTAQVIVAAIGASNTITELAPFIVPQGSGYAVQNSVPTVAVSPSVGTGAEVDILQVGPGGTITKKNSTTTFFQDGFSKGEQVSGGVVSVPNWQFIYNGVTYTYGGGLDSETLTGVTPDPTSIPANAIIMSAVIPVSDIPSSPTQFAFSTFVDFTCDFLSVINNQVYVGSYGSPAIFVSSDVDYTNYQGVTNGGLGTPFAIEFDNNPVGISQKNYVPFIFGGSSDVYQVNITSQVVQQSGASAGADVIQVVGITKISLAENEAPVAQEFIDTNGEYIIWLGQDSQVHVLGAFKDLLLSDKAPILSTEVYDELTDVDFTGGALRIIGEFIYLTAPVQGTHYIYQTREFVDETGTAKSEKIWHSPQVSGISRFANIEGVIYGHSYLNPMIYAVWDTGQWYDDSPTGDQLPYQCVLAMAYQQVPNKGGKSTRRQGLGVFDKIYFEGYMTRGTPLYATVYFDYQGAAGAQTLYINSPAVSGAPAGSTTVKNVKFYDYTTAPSLGQDSLADNPLGEAITHSTDEQDYLPKFRAIRKVTPQDCFEAGVELYSYEIGARWELLAWGINWKLSQRVPRELL